jgi:CubicO group peptidase (beta-lactamase class C family)
MLGLPLAHEPGSHYAYSSGGINLAMGAVRKMTGRWVPEFFDEVFARPMGISSYHMNLMPDGEAYGGGGMYMAPRDLLKFGQLILQKGTWEGHRLVSASWLAASTSRQVAAPGGSADGFGWHLHRLPTPGGGIDIIEANGNGGQFLIVVPSQQIVLVVTAGNYNQYGIWRSFREEWLPRYLLAP